MALRGILVPQNVLKSNEKNGREKRILSAESKNRSSDLRKLLIKMAVVDISNHSHFILFLDHS
jgi:hypothetical protein